MGERETWVTIARIGLGSLQQHPFSPRLGMLLTDEQVHHHPPSPPPLELPDCGLCSRPKPASSRLRNRPSLNEDLTKLCPQDNHHGKRERNSHMH